MRGSHVFYLSLSLARAEVARLRVSAVVTAAVTAADTAVVGTAVEQHARRNGFSVVESLVGHGIGRNLHEDPQVPNYRCFTTPDPVMETGLVIAIEPMINEGTKQVVTTEDQWTVVTADRRLSAHFEHTVAVTDSGALVLTRR